MVQFHYSAIAGIIPVKIIETYLFFVDVPTLKLGWKDYYVKI